MLLLETDYVNTRQANILKRKNILTVNDLARFAPRSYTDYRKIQPVQEIPHGSHGVVAGRLEKIELKTSKSNGRDFLSGRIIQQDGIPILLIMFMNTYRLDDYQLMVGENVVVCGKVTYDSRFGYSISNPDAFCTAHTYSPYIKKNYTKFSGMSEAMLQKLIVASVDATEEPLEQAVLDRYSLTPYREALTQLHFAESKKDVRSALTRLAGDDLLYFAMMLKKEASGPKETDIAFPAHGLLDDFLRSLPFKLTLDQRKCVSAMYSKASKGHRINALVQGDVGCGKTITAACLMVAAASNGYQSVLMAPRTVLAQQHYAEISGYAAKLGLECVFLHSGMTAKEKKAALASIKDGIAAFIVGTHSCFSKDVEYANLGLVVTDEEHLFGVVQKDSIREKGMDGLHYISMSATPIPRTVASVIYGDSKEIFSIKTKPAGRKDIITKVIQNRTDIFGAIEDEIKAGHRCYVVCPAIEENEESNITSIEEIEKKYRKHFSQSGIKISVVNGKMKKQDVEAEMSDFKEGISQILISTTVIEVGVNVPEATVMVIEQADRFGLASLHQLRGRVGRSDLQSYCYLISEDAANERLAVLERTNDGFEIAEADMRQRGAGNLIGTEQAGMNKYMDEMLRYPELYNKMKDAAEYCVSNGFGEKLLDMYLEHKAAVS